MLKFHFQKAKRNERKESEKEKLSTLKLLNIDK